MDKFSIQGQKHRHNRLTHSGRFRLSKAEHDAFLKLCAEMSVTPSSAIRRLVRQAINLGPTLDAESAEQVLALTAQTRHIGVNVNQWVRSINRGLIPRNDEVRGWLVNLSHLLDEYQRLYVSICVSRARMARASILNDDDETQPLE